MPKWSITIQMTPAVQIECVGDSREEFFYDVRENCYFVEKYGPIGLMKYKASITSMTETIRKIMKTMPDYDEALKIWAAPKTALYEKIVDEEKERIRPEYIIEDDDGKGEKKVAKASSADKGTVHLSADMTPYELKEAVEKGGMKTIDLDEYDDVKSILAEAKRLY